MKKTEMHSGRMEAQLSQWGAKLDELQATGGERWETFKVDLDKAWDGVEAAFKKLAEPVGAAPPTPQAPMPRSAARGKKQTEHGAGPPPRA
jgi:hypothetical protein